MRSWTRRIVVLFVLAATASVPVEGVASAGGSSRLVDKTGTFALRVPEDWDYTDVTPGMADDGTFRGQIVATSSLYELETTGHAPILWATAIPAPTSPETWLANTTVFSRCVRDWAETFDNGDVLGTRVSWSGCGGRKAVMVQVAVRSKRNDSAGVGVQLMLPRADVELVDRILGSLEILAEQPASASTPDGDDALDALPLDRTFIDRLVVDGVPSDVTHIVDDTHALAIGVPPGFTDTNTVNEFNDDGSPRPIVVAAPDLDDFLRDGETGVLAIRLPHVDPATLLANTGYPFCDGRSGPISLPPYKGVLNMWEDCSGPLEVVASVALVPADRSSTVLLIVAIPDDDLTVLQIALASVELLEPRSAPAQ